MRIGGRGYADLILRAEESGRDTPRRNNIDLNVPLILLGIVTCFWDKYKITGERIWGF